MSATYVMINYRKDRLFNRIGLQGGLTLLHYSNGSFKAPNTGINSITLNLGMTYDMDDFPVTYKYNLSDDKSFSEALKYNLVFRSGVNESDVVGSGQYPFYVFSAYLDKRINRKSALQAGVDIFFSNFLKEYILYNSIAFPDRAVDQFHG